MTPLEIQVRPMSPGRADELATRSPDGPLVSIYLPLAPGRDGAEKTRLRLKNLVTSAARQLEALGASTRMLRPLVPYTEEVTAWPGSERGLGVFVVEGAVEIYGLPDPVEELAVVAPHFHVRPLLRLYQDDGRFFVLALSLREARLLEANHRRVRRVVVRGRPDPRAHPRDPRSLQAHSVGKDIMFHGQGAGDDDAKTLARKWMRDVATAVDARLAGADAPLVLACVEYLHPLYREASHYQDIVNEPLSGNFDGVGDDELRDAAWPLVKWRFVRGRGAASFEYATRRREGRTVSGVRDVLLAAERSRVETLYLCDGAYVWGRERADGSFADLGDHRPGAEDLLDRAAVAVHAAGGEVVELRREEMPTRAAASATLRYAE